MSAVATPLTLPETPPEVKRYQRQKLVAHLTSAVLSLAFLVVMAIWGRPRSTRGCAAGSATGRGCGWWRWRWCSASASNC